MTRRSAMSFALAIAVLWGTGCGSDGSPGLDTGTAADTGRTAELGPGQELGVKPEAGPKTEGGAGKTVIVTYGGSTYTVDVTKPQPVTLDGAPYARLSDVVLLALPGKAVANLAADFEGAGGFKPGSKANCATLIPVAGDKLAKGYAQIQSLNMRWDDDLGYPGCLAPKGLVKIILADK
jgi:hypothetical protein